ncbi:adenylate kinase [Facklamia sp. DSM 111018]|uniref:Adenylate kinase n=1 Tax=Facklamia lactis TaxID=2749967 RepID=A0ABS0LMM9_9LACT|nr:adenylate kinase [Facklamia lactis]MBG9979904.1 adenylate kinase [Facklamia lactis]MBG9985416.1 adenylate kinase [Facklamia lactis]
MKKIIIIGCPGSGKSTFSRALHQITGLPLYHLDMLNWKTDRTTVEKSVFHEKLRQTMLKDEWIIEGNYGSTIERRLQVCDTVFFLDYPVDTCLKGIEERKGKKRSDLPWIETSDNTDKEFENFIKNYHTESRPDVIQLLNKYSHKQVHIFSNREQGDKYLDQLSKNNQSKKEDI